ncbi:uncharacterized protein FPRO_15888 [Fusarium proliferatum ET1]|uniref:Uncharacterized protein n=1 Tax=Fusarium proliferatum (strain ET1) TaxID=1227346 RepID=A0A1L7WA96_FUSPR|nr:uncharacterized protein FPRO_15888 [Fusarium proliferatum ET1]CZR49529.1 uncharacterized protein FPRO_15888 [Fusarium proliferatum ET1]
MSLASRIDRNPLETCAINNRASAAYQDLSTIILPTYTLTEHRRPNPLPPLHRSRRHCR